MPLTPSSKTAPHNAEAEESVIGAVFLDNESFDRVADGLTADDFYLERLSRVFTAMSSLSEQGLPIDVVTVADKLKQRGELQAVGGVAYLAELTERVPTAANVEYYANVVREDATLRAVIRVCTETITSAYTSDIPSADFVDRAEQAIFRISDGNRRSRPHRLDSLISESVQRLEALYERKEEITGVATGFNELDKITGGLQPSDLIIVAGRPSMGKCVSGDTELVMADGSIRTMRDIATTPVDADSARDRVLTLDDDWKVQQASPSHYVDDGRKPVFAVRTRLGRSVTTTIVHPFLTKQGWKPLGELSVGTKIAVPRRLAVFGDLAVGRDQAETLGRFFGDETQDGDCSRTGVVSRASLGKARRQQFVRTARKAARAWQRNAPRSVGLAGTEADVGSSVLVSGPVQASTGTLRAAAVTIEAGRAVRQSLRLNVPASAAAPKAVPGSVFTMPREETATFLHYALADQAWLRRNADLPAAVVWQAPSRGLARQVAHLLLRFGVVAALESDAHTTRLEITEPSSLRVLAAEIGIFGKQVELAEMLEQLAPPETADEGDVYWDEIVAIQPAGLDHVYDLTIPKTHNFVAGDVFVHNTAFVLNLAENTACEHGTGVAVFSLEMSKEQLVMRMLCSRAELDILKVRTGVLKDRQFTRLAKAAGQLGQARIYIDDTPSLSVMELRAKARRLKKDPEANLGLVVVDYLQLMRGGGEESREQEISAISRSLKALAKELDIPVIALSQLNRQVELRQDKQPVMADLRESGAIEQDADIIAFLYRDEQYNRDSPEAGTAKVIIAKQRNGPTGEVRLSFEKAFARFGNLSFRDDEPGGYSGPEEYGAPDAEGA